MEESQKNIAEEVEGRIIDWIALGGGGRLVAFKGALPNTLVIKKRGDYQAGLSVTFQVHTFFGMVKQDFISEDFPEKSFNSQKSLYLVFAYFDEIKQKLNDDVWIVPSEDFKKLAEQVSPENEKMLRFKVPLDLTQQSQYSKYIVNKKKLSMLLIDALQSDGKMLF